MAEGIKIEVVSPENLVLSDDVASVTVPGTDGYFTVMGDHAAMMTTLKAGFVTVTSEGGDVRSFYVRGGFATYPTRASPFWLKKRKLVQTLTVQRLTRRL